MTRRLLASAVAMCLAASVVLTAAPSSAAVESNIQPGSQMTGPAGCTFNFVFRDTSGTLYIGTAGHCLPPGTGTRVRNRDGEFGTVVFTVFHGARDDFALIRVDDEHQEEVVPSVRYWGGPVAAMPEAEARLGSPAYASGYGMVFGQTAATRPRPGALYAMSGGKWSGGMPIIFGDSGGPILSETGKAIGVVTGIRGSYMYGTTVERALQLLDDAGIDVELVTAPLEALPQV